MKKGYINNIEALTQENIAFRRVIYTDKKCQIALMSLLPGEETEEEIHTVDQLLRIEKGVGEVLLDGALYSIVDKSIILIPSETKHIIMNTGLEAMKLYVIYIPPLHRDQVVHQTKEESEADTESYENGHMS